MSRARLANDRAHTLRVALTAYEKAKVHRASLTTIANDLSGLVRLVMAWGRRDYGTVPWRTIALAVGALVYFVNPFDAVPDQIPGLGYVDDASVIALVVHSIRADIEPFLRWEKTRARAAMALPSAPAATPKPQAGMR